MGRKKVKIDYDTVKNLAKICCTQEEIASVLGCSVKTLQRRRQFNKAYQDGLNDARATAAMEVSRERKHYHADISR